MNQFKIILLNLVLQRPEDPAKWWPNILDTKKIPPACPTYNLKYIQVHKPTFNMTSEDCLYMNVYVPKVRIVYYALVQSNMNIYYYSLLFTVYNKKNSYNF